MLNATYELDWKGKRLKKKTNIGPTRKIRTDKNRTLETH